MKTIIVSIALLAAFLLCGCAAMTQRKAIGEGYAGVSLTASLTTTALEKHWVSVAEAQLVKTDLDVASAALDEWARQLEIGNRDAISKAAAAASVALQALAQDRAKLPATPSPATHPGGSP